MRSKTVHFHGLDLGDQRPTARASSVWHGGFTLVELLVVIAIIGILVALLLPAIQSAREAARRAQCQSNLKNVALGLINYESSHKIFPVGMTWDPARNSAGVSRLTEFGPNWIIAVLPEIEEQALYDSFDFTRPINDRTVGPNNRNREARGTVINVLLCPSDQHSGVLYEGAIATHGDNWARTNYAANAGRGDIWPGRVTGPDSAEWRDNCKRGVTGVNAAVPYRRITDGTTKTILVGEIRAGLNATDARGVWAMGHAGASLLAGYGSGGDDNGPNACGPFADDVYAPGVCRSGDLAQTAQSECMTCDGGYFAQATIRSTHFGGAFVAMCDGSIAFVSDDIETSGDWGSCCTPWDYMIASSDSKQGGPYNGVRRGGCM